MKKRLTQAEEFEIMKLVLDKFLWLGSGIMAYGFYVLVSNDVFDLGKGLSLMLGGAVVLMIFMAIILKEYEIVK